MVVESRSQLEYLAVKNNSKTAVIMIHGYGASMHDLYGLSDVLTVGGGADWFFPNGPLKINLGFMMEGSAWFPVDMQALEAAMQSGSHRIFADKCPEEFLKSHEQLLVFIESIMASYDEIIIGGFSQGAMLATHLIPNLKKLRAAVLFSSTLIAKDRLEENLGSGKAIPFFQSHGKADPLLNYSEAMDLYELLKQYRLDGEMVSFDGGHEIPPIVISKCNAFLARI